VTNRAFASVILSNDVKRELGIRHRTWIERPAEDWLEGTTLSLELQTM